MKLFGVAKLLTKISYVEPISKKEINIKLEGCAGYIPIFETIEEAQKHTCNGKYKIMLLNVPDTKIKNKVNARKNRKHGASNAN